MKRLRFIYSLLLTTTLFSCSYNEPEIKENIKGVEQAFDLSYATSFYNIAEISIPAGVRTVYIENYTQENDGTKIITPIAVNPIIKTPENGKNVEPFGDVKLLINSPKKTLVAVYYTIGDNPTSSNYRAKQYVLYDFPIEKAIIGELGKTKYALTVWDPSKGIPGDTIVNSHKYTFAYGGTKCGFGYVLPEAYEIKDRVITKINSDLDPYNVPWNNEETPPILRAPQESEMTSVYLKEPAGYVTMDADQTFYHSSGCVFFEDSWPTVHTGGGSYDEDFDDCVIDYDVEAKIMPDELLESDGWREQVKVVLHLRAVGSDQTNGPYRVGIQLHGFNTNNVKSIDTYFTLDSYQNPHGELPAVTINTLQNPELSNHYETDPMNPIIELSKLEVMGQQRAGLGEDAEYTYTNGTVENHTVFNLTYGYKGGPDASQYDPTLATDLTLPYQFSKIQQQKFYNAIPGYINVAGGLFTMTVIYHMKSRLEMSPVEREEVKQNMINTVFNTYNQNFYIMKKDNTPIGLKGYSPVFSPSASKSKYNQKLQKGVEDGTLDASIPYSSTTGSVWGFKCPTLTRHIWNKLYFSMAYPHYEDWINSKGANYSDWYENGINEKYMSCWW